MHGEKIPITLYFFELVRRVQFILLFALLPIGYVQAQESKSMENATWEDARHAWKAWWVTHPEASLLEYNVFLFRNTFHLEEIPDSLKIHLSADSRYKLYINGQFITMGPAKGTPANWQYETLEVAQFLRTGKNVVAVQVYNFGEHLPASLFSRKTALILQAEGPLGDQLNTGSGNWQVSENSGYRPIPVTGEMVHHYYVGPPCDSLIADKMLWGWEHTEYDDSAWWTVKNLERGAGKGYAHGVFWHLVPRRIPLLTDSLEGIGEIVRTTGLRESRINEFGNGPLLIPANTEASILIDRKYLTSGFPHLTLSGGKGSFLKLTYSEALYDQGLEKGNRNEISGKSIKGYYDIILPDGGDERVFSPLWFRTFRFIQIDIHTDEEPLEIKDFTNRVRVYPFEKAAIFQSDDPLLSEMNEIGWRTARHCATETYMDCPYWEQLQYVGDTRIQALVSLYMSGDDRLMRNALEQGKNSRTPDGLLLSRAPSSQVQIIPPFSLVWIWMVHDHLMYRDDPQFIEQFLPVIQGILGWFERHTAENAMLGPLDWFNFCDWTDGYTMGCPPGADLGGSALISLMYAHSLEKSSEIFDFFGRSRSASEYRALGEKVANAVKEHCFDAERELLAETTDKRQFSQHTNIFGILTNRFTPEEQERVVDKLLKDSTLIQTTIYFRFYLAEALYKAGYGDKYLETLGPWKDMMHKGLTTWAEGDVTDRSDCHAWGASPNFHFFSIVAGIRPTAPGFKEVMVAPSLGSLESLRAEIPHPNGVISMLLDNSTEGQLQGNIKLPVGTKGVFRWQGQLIIINQKLTLNKRK